MKLLRSVSRSSAFLFAPLLFASCYSRVVVVDEPGALNEYEPNDQVWNANYFGLVQSGDALHIHGSISSAFDFTDGLAFTADAPCSVEFVLHASNPDADLSVWLYDPHYDEFVAQFPVIDGSAIGTLDFHGWNQDFHLVLVTEWADAGWSLDVYTSHLHGSPVAQEGASAGTPFERQSDVPAPSLRARSYRTRGSEVELDPRAIFGAGRLYFIDPRTGDVTSERFVAREDGIVLERR